MTQVLLPDMLPPAAEPALRRPKSSTAFRTISEVADDLDVAQHVLRFWESKFSQVRPLKRGGGRRYYRPEDVDVLRQIRSLLYDEGYTIKGAQRLLRARRTRAAASDEAVATVARSDPGPSRPAPTDVTQSLRALRSELVELKEMVARVRREIG